MTTKNIMDSIKSGEELLLIAAEEHLKKLRKKHEKAKAAMGERNDAVSRIIEIRSKGVALAKSAVGGSLGAIKEVQRELSALSNEEQRLIKLMDQDYTKISDAEFKAQIESENLFAAIENMKFRLRI